MKTATKIPIKRPSDRFVFHDVSWKRYELLLKAFGKQHLRHAYSHRTFEILSPLYFHERNKKCLGSFIELLALELNLPLLSAGSTTLKRKEIGKGLEPDECFYVQNVPAVLGKREIDLSQDPPPDLALEMEYRSSIVKRIPIYLKLRVPEVWRYDGQRLTILRLNLMGRYETASSSIVFPFLPMQEVEVLLQEAQLLDDTAWKRQVIKWIRQTFPST